MIEIYKKSTAILLAILLLTGCDGPTWQFPGGALSGEEKPFDLSVVPQQGGVIQLETNPDEPYSVNVGYVVIGGNMYVDPTESRSWYQNMKANPLVRVRFDGTSVVYSALAVAETEQAVLSQFEDDRHVFRFLPRKQE